MSSRSGAGESSVRGVSVPSMARSGSCLSGMESVCGVGRGAEFCCGRGEPESGAGERDELLSSCRSWEGWMGDVVRSDGRCMLWGEMDC